MSLWNISLPSLKGHDHHGRALMIRRGQMLHPFSSRARKGSIGQSTWPQALVKWVPAQERQEDNLDIKYWFTKDISPLTNLIVLLALDEGRVVDVILTSRTFLTQFSITWPWPSWWNKTWISAWLIGWRIGRTASLKGWCLAIRSPADRLVTSGILQGEIPGLQWFRIFIGNLDESTKSTLSNSVDKLPPGKLCAWQQEKPTTHCIVLAEAWSVGAGKWIFLSLPPSEATLGALGAV